jgi:hypothetical protein
MKYGYARVSPGGKSESVEAQARQLTKAGCRKIFRDMRIDQQREARPGQGDEQLLFGNCGFKEQTAFGDEMNRHLRWRILL